MAARIVVFGATGYTGELIASRLVAAGAAPVLAGRSPERLSALASRLGGLEVVRADAMRQNTVFDLVSSADDVLISTVGPFSKWGLPAERSGARLLTAMGYDFAPGALAGALALASAEG